MDADWAKTYAAMDDGELVALAAESDELVEEARAALWTELRRRGLEGEAAEAYRNRPRREGAPTPTDNLVTVMLFNDLARAGLARTVLESEGIRCFLADEHLVRMDWFYTFMLGRLKLQVNEQDAGRARELLEALGTELADLPGSGPAPSERRFRWLTMKNFVWFTLIYSAFVMLVILYGYLSQGH